MNSFTLLALFALVFAAVVVPVSANDDDDAACNVANTNSIFDECIPVLCPEDDDEDGCAYYGCTVDINGDVADDDDTSTFCSPIALGDFSCDDAIDLCNNMCQDADLGPVESIECKNEVGQQGVFCQCALAFVSPYSGAQSTMALSFMGLIAVVVAAFVAMVAV